MSGTRNLTGICQDIHRNLSLIHILGIRVVMLTGDNEQTAGAIGKQAGVDEVIAGVLPDGKEMCIRDRDYSALDNQAHGLYCGVRH